MSDIVIGILSEADYFILLLFRVSGLIISSPLFGRVGVPNMVKIAFCVGLTMVFFVGRPLSLEISYNTLIGFFLLCACELLLGICLAFVTNLFFTLTFTAGHMIDMQIGFGIVNVYDIQNNTQIPMIGNLLNLTLLVTFFSVNGHLRLIQIVQTTLTYLPIGNLRFAPEIGLVALEIFCEAFLLGIMVALPVIASGLVLELCFGVMVRTVPQMNMFVVGIPLKLLAGFLILSLTLPAFIGFSDYIFGEMFDGVEKMFSTFLSSP